MTTIFDETYPRTLDALVAQLTAKPRERVEAWLFEDGPARRAAERRLAAAGVEVRLRSAYKPLLCFFREEVDTAGLERASIRYPRHEAAHPDRFRLECYPLKPLLAPVETVFEAGGEGLDYEVELTRADGRVITHRVFAPNVLREGTTGDPVLAASGWLRIGAGQGEALASEFETLFLSAVAAVRTARSEQERGRFERLILRVDLAADDEPLGWGEEVLSLREAMHEELYFALRELLDAPPAAAGAPPAGCPGQIVPDVRRGDGPARLVITTDTHESDGAETAGAAMPLETATRPLTIAQIRAELGRLPGGTRFTAGSRQGRVSHGFYKPGTGSPVLITAAQHANETSGVVGALRAARRLADDPAAHFALVPVENVDGYELHQRLIAHNPRHMHHAARHAACGNDISQAMEAPDDERRAHLKGLEMTGAKLHINLHGYPSHEWTRPLSGYLPKGFEKWTIPKGFFLICNYHAGWGDAGRTLVRRLTERLAENRDLVALNARQLEALRGHSTAMPFEVLNGFAIFLSESPQSRTPLSLITEAPDETIYGDGFVLQHTAQMQAVLHCVSIYQGLAAASS
ncbi:peptidase M14 [Aurantimonas sp. VKM B-3413]|uniref:peptidase M14 n=1 Tax=Aurantimonas sp. VKM B-3413 TaxID=2779401 RepID=UPI001E4C6861|nr:peptidase M14 [Aurantimonas sp. VKM B-3413]MCB8838298.1 peptidase M14 [Aurantimonas sp. VKM B-3413]